MGLIFKSPIFSYKSGQIKNFLKFFQKSLDKRKSLCYTIRAQIRRKVSSVGRASALQAEGHRFEPCTFHQIADLAHLVERHLAKVEVAGSSPVIRSKKQTVNAQFP